MSDQVQVSFSRGFTVPTGEISGLRNPLSIANTYQNMYGSQGRVHFGEEEGVSFAFRPHQNSQTEETINKLRAGAESHAQVALESKEGHTPISVTFTLDEKKFDLLRGKIAEPVIYNRGGMKEVFLQQIRSFEDLIALGQREPGIEREVIIQAGSLTQDELRTLDIKIGLPSKDHEGYEYKDFEVQPNFTGESGGNKFV